MQGLGAFICCTYHVLSSVVVVAELAAQDTMLANGARRQNMYFCMNMWNFATPAVNCRRTGNL